jgi:hypothetical protein
MKNGTRRYENENSDTIGETCGGRKMHKNRAMTEKIGHIPRRTLSAILYFERAFNPFTV